MRLLFGWFMMLAITASATAKDLSEIHGRVKYTGIQLEPDTLTIRGSDFCERIHEQNPLTRNEVVVNSNGTLENVVVWVEAGWPEGEKPDALTTGSATLELHNCSMRPHLTVLQAGQPLEIVNRDATAHNVNSRPANNPPFNITLTPESDARQVVFEQPEIGIKFRSDIHPWMTAKVVVLDHPVYAITGDDGTFKLPPLPVGEYKLSAWHESFGVASTDVLLQRAVTADIEFTFTATGAKSGIQVNSFDTSRPTTGTVDMDRETTGAAN